MPNCEKIIVTNFRMLNMTCNLYMLNITYLPDLPSDASCFCKDAPGVGGGLADDSMSLSKLLSCFDFFFVGYLLG